ncbi:MAG: hypothetical protein C0504_12260 [Candidatus Solibacter sp.]|nr:hypothetical protein [Candidatus Solibacter sp.]
MTLKRFMKRWSECGWRQRLAVVCAFMMGAMCRVALRVGPYEAARRSMGLIAGAGSGLSAEQIAWAAMAGAGRVPGAKCLVVALVGEAMLRASGYEAELCIGVSTTEGFKAHAWVELDGRAVIGAAADGGYARLEPVGAVAA